MPRGDKSKCPDEQERKADQIAESHGERAVSEKEAERRAWATIDEGGGKEGRSGRGKSTAHPAPHKRGPVGGKAAVSHSLASRSSSATKAAATRKRNAEHGTHS